MLLCFGQTIPPMKLKTLDGKDADLPIHGSNKPLLLMIGFSHRSSQDFAHWNKLARTPYFSDSRIDYLELADLQGLPSLIARMILHGMRRAIGEPERAHFAPFYSDEEKWKSLVSYGDPGIAYLVLTDAAGKVVWQGHGSATEAKSAELESAIHNQVSHP